MKYVGCYLEVSKWLVTMAWLLSPKNRSKVGHGRFSTLRNWNLRFVPLKQCWGRNSLWFSDGRDIGSCSWRACEASTDEPQTKKTPILLSMNRDRWLMRRSFYWFIWNNPLYNWVGFLIPYIYTKHLNNLGPLLNYSHKPRLAPTASLAVKSLMQGSPKRRQLASKEYSHDAVNAASEGQ